MREGGLGWGEWVGEMESVEGGEGGGDVVVLELVHLPAPDLAPVCVGRVVEGRLDEFWVLRGEAVEGRDERGVRLTLETQTECRWEWDDTATRSACVFS